MNVVANTMRMLIGYASRFGSTREIAMRIAGAVRTHGIDVEVQSVDEISDCEQYEAVVFGSGVYDGSWTVEATELLRRHAAVLARKAVWLFSGFCSKVSAGTRATTATGRTSMSEPRGSRRSFERSTESRRRMVASAGHGAVTSRIRLSPEIQSDESIDSNVRLPPQARLETDRDAIADEDPHTSSNRERPFA